MADTAALVARPSSDSQAAGSLELSMLLSQLSHTRRDSKTMYEDVERTLSKQHQAQQEFEHQDREMQALMQQCAEYDNELALAKQEFETEKASFDTLADELTSLRQLVAELAQQAHEASVEHGVAAFQGAQTSDRLTALTRLVNQARYDCEHAQLARDTFVQALTSENWRLNETSSSLKANTRVELAELSALAPEFVTENGGGSFLPTDLILSPGGGRFGPSSATRSPAFATMRAPSPSASSMRGPSPLPPVDEEVDDEQSGSGMKKGSGGDDDEKVASGELDFPDAATPSSSSSSTAFNYAINNNNSNKTGRQSPLLLSSSRSLISQPSSSSFSLQGSPSSSSVQSLRRAPSLTMSSVFVTNLLGAIPTPVTPAAAAAAGVGTGGFVSNLSPTMQRARSRQSPSPTTMMMTSSPLPSIRPSASNHAPLMRAASTPFAQSSSSSLPNANGRVSSPMQMLDFPPLNGGVSTPTAVHSLADAASRLSDLLLDEDEAGDQSPSSPSQNYFHTTSTTPQRSPAFARSQSTPSYSMDSFAQYQTPTKRQINDGDASHMDDFVVMNDSISSPSGLPRTPSSLSSSSSPTSNLHPRQSSSSSSSSSSSRLSGPEWFSPNTFGSRHNHPPPFRAPSPATQFKSPLALQRSPSSTSSTTTTTTTAAAAASVKSSSPAPKSHSTPAPQVSATTQSSSSSSTLSNRSSRRPLSSTEFQLEPPPNSTSPTSPTSPSSPSSLHTPSTSTPTRRLSASASAPRLSPAPTSPVSFSHTRGHTFSSDLILQRGVYEVEPLPQYSSLPQLSKVYDLSRLAAARAAAAAPMAHVGARVYLPPASPPPALPSSTSQHSFQQQPTSSPQSSPSSSSSLNTKRPGTSTSTTSSGSGSGLSDRPQTANSDSSRSTSSSSNSSTHSTLSSRRTSLDRSSSTTSSKTATTTTSAVTAGRRNLSIRT